MLRFFFGSALSEPVMWILTRCKRSHNRTQPNQKNIRKKMRETHWDRPNNHRLNKDFNSLSIYCYVNRRQIILFTINIYKCIDCTAHKYAERMNEWTKTQTLCAVNLCIFLFLEISVYFRAFEIKIEGKQQQPKKLFSWENHHFHHHHKPIGPVKILLVRNYLNEKKAPSNG